MNGETLSLKEKPRTIKKFEHSNTRSTIQRFKYFKWSQHVEPRSAKVSQRFAINSQIQQVYLSSNRHFIRGLRSIDPSHVTRIALERERLALFNSRSDNGDTFPDGSPRTSELTAGSRITGSLEISRAVYIYYFSITLRWPKRRNCAWTRVRALRARRVTRLIRSLQRLTGESGVSGPSGEWSSRARRDHHHYCRRYVSRNEVALIALPSPRLTRNRTSLDRSRDCRSGHMISTCQDRAWKGWQLSEFRINFYLIFGKRSKVKRKAAKCISSSIDLQGTYVRTFFEHPRTSLGYISDKVCY